MLNEWHHQPGEDNIILDNGVKITSKHNQLFKKVNFQRYRPDY